MSDLRRSTLSARQVRILLRDHIMSLVDETGIGDESFIDCSYDPDVLRLDLGEQSWYFRVRVEEMSKIQAEGEGG